jgi:hypothetical protein
MSEVSKTNERLIFGDKGFNIYSAGESSVDELFSVIQAAEDSEISVLEIVNADPITSLVVPAGMPIYGTFKGITVVSGKIIAYKR